MNIRTFGIIFLLSFSVIFGTQDVFADTLFQDDFSMDPEINGWTETFDLIQSDGIRPITLNLPGHIGHGNEVIFEKNSPGPPPDVTPRSFSIERVIPTSGFENIRVSLTAHQTSDNYEPEDFLEISIDTNNDGIFESILKDVNIWDGVEDQSPIDTIEPNGQEVPTSTGLLLLPNSAADNPNFKIKIEASFNSQNEDYFLTEFEVTGEAIQENNVIGGKIIPIESTILILAGSQSFSWILLIAFSLTGIGLLVFFRKSIN